MMNLSLQLLRTFTIKNGKLYNIRTYPSEDIEAVMTNGYLQMIDKLITADEKKTLTWKGYLYMKGDDEYSYYRRATFVMTDKNLYVATGNIAQEMVAISSLSDCRDYCIFNEDVKPLPSFVLNFSDAIEFLYNKGDPVEQLLQNELNRQDIRLA